MHMARCVLSWHAKIASKKVHVVWNGASSLIEDRGSLSGACIISDRVFACWLAVARVLFRVVDMARCEPSQQAKTASKTVHVAPNGIIFVLCVAHYLSTSLYLPLIFPRA